jgi:hypothetical protein
MLHITHGAGSGSLTTSSSPPDCGRSATTKPDSAWTGGRGSACAATYDTPDLARADLNALDDHAACKAAPLSHHRPGAPNARFCTPVLRSSLDTRSVQIGGTARGCWGTGDHALQQQASALPVGTNSSRGARSLNRDALAANPVAIQSQSPSPDVPHCMRVRQDAHQIRVFSVPNW